MTYQRYLRLTVDLWDDNKIFGHTADRPDATVAIPYAPRFAYLGAMLFSGAQVNVVFSLTSGSVETPGESDVAYLILEPDYLVDITAVAHCFQTYAESPMVHLIGRISPSPHSEAIVLGNFAGQLLDDELHQQHDYARSVRHFFRHNATSLLVTTLQPSFHDDARKQQGNIHRAMTDVLPSIDSRFQPQRAMLEPSFFSEMFGLQGRMDLLQDDHSVLIEQKSGKADFGSTKDDPLQREEHYAQMLLYMLLLRYNYDAPADIRSCLLYSKYTNALVPLDFSDALVLRALQLRNGIAWLETQLGSGRGEWSWRRLLEGLTPEKLNSKNSSGPLWRNWQYPQLLSLLTPIQTASPLERTYYFRMLDFISREHYVAKVGVEGNPDVGFSAKWRTSLPDKQEAGNIFCDLRLDTDELLRQNAEDGRVSSVTLSFCDSGANYMANFRIGDIIVLYPYTNEAEPDVRQTMVFRANISDIGPESITVFLRNEQTDRRLFMERADMLWAIEHDFIESSFSGLYRGMHAFLSAPKRRRELLLLQRLSDVDDAVQLKGEYGAFNDLSLKVKQSQELFLIIGPPGTGKTSFGMLNTLKEELLEDGSSVLILSYTNRAVDEVCSKLKEEGIDFLRLGGELSCAEDYHDHLLSRQVRPCNNVEEVRNLFYSHRVVCATTTSMTSNVALLAMRQFSLCIIDEASQILEPHLMAILSATTEQLGGERVSSIKKIVMIGDHKQLPAVVQQDKTSSGIASDDELLAGIGLTDCRLSLFERLLRRYRDDSRLCYMLTKQGRMHHDIADFPSRFFYEGRLTEVPLPHQVAATVPPSKDDSGSVTPFPLHARLAFVDVPSPESSVSDKVNQNEADVIANAVLRIYEKEKENFDTERTIGVIVPYRNQIATIRNTIARLAPELPLTGISIDTVERFQGSQRRYIIFGTTIRRPYQLDFLCETSFQEGDAVIDRKLNVAMTRAQEHLYVVGNAALLSRNPTYKALIDYCAKPFP